MKQYTILFLLLPTLLLAQRGGEILSDTVYFSGGVNECGDSVYLLTQVTTFRGGRVYQNTEPVGYNKDKPCDGIKWRDTTTLINAFARPLEDYGRQQAEAARAFIFQARALKSFQVIDKALKVSKTGGLFSKIEKTYADSLIGSYILVRPGQANTSITVNKTASGNVRVRLAANSFLPIVMYSDTWITVRNLGGANNDVDLYEIEPGRWVSLLGTWQMVSSARQVVKGK